MLGAQFKRPFAGGGGKSDAVLDQQICHRCDVGEIGKVLQNQRLARQ
jgi:hypothetical protein